MIARKWAAVIAAAVVWVLSVGCDVDQKIDSVDQDWRLAGKVMVAAGQKFAQGADETEESRYLLRKAEIDAKTDEFINRHTDADGRLANNPAPGEPAKPLTAADLRALLKDRDKMLLAAAEEHKRWNEFRDQWRDALAKFDAANELLAEKKTEWLDKKKSTAAALNTALGVLSAAGGGIALGALAF